MLAGTQEPAKDKLEQMAAPSVPGRFRRHRLRAQHRPARYRRQDRQTWSADTAEQSVFAVRRARLVRYTGKPDDLKQLLQSAPDPITPRELLERVYDLLAVDNASAAHDLVTKHSSLLGPMSSWLGVLVEAAKNKTDAKVKASQLDLPPPAAPLPLRIAVARALAAAGDKRAKDIIGVMLKAQPKNPDLLLAVEDLKKK